MSARVEWRCEYCRRWFPLDKKHRHPYAERLDFGERRTVRA